MKAGFLGRSVIAILVVGLAWCFLGVERVVGDHEVGVAWEPFVKHRPSLRMRFQNPAQHGLDIVPFDGLQRDDQHALIEFCAIRFGLTDVAKCYAILDARIY